MTDDLDLMHLASQGQKLGNVDDVDYREVSVVFAWPAAGTPAIYCQRADWPTTPAARLFARDVQLAELAEAFSLQASEALKQAQRAEAAERRIAELEAQLKETPVDAQAEQFERQAAYLNGGGSACPDCPATFKNERALRMHRQRAHQGMVAGRPAPAQFVEPLDWRCAAKGCTGAHARDLHDPLFCTLHAQRQLSNGVEVTR